MRIALGLIVLLAPVAAQASRYTLADTNGVPSCNFVILYPKQQLDYGFFYARNCNPPAPTLIGSGVATKLNGSPDKVWSFSLTGPATTTSLYFFNIKTLTWIEYAENGDVPLQIVGSGILLPGVHKPPAAQVKQVTPGAMRRTP